MEHTEHVNWENNNKSGISDTFKIDNIITKNASKISNKFCEYFSDIGNQFASKIPKPDKLFHHYLIHNPNYLFNSSKLISILINKSMETGQVPANMKIAKNIAIYKSKEKNNIGNNRPISFYHQSRKFGKRQLIKDHMAFVKLSIFFMITNTDVGRNIPL